jgi:hypothetical protein
MCFRIAPFAAAALIPLSWAAVAKATPLFPGDIQMFVGSAVPPPCTICHTNPLGGIGTATTTFALYLRSRGLVAFDDTKLKDALAAAQGEGHSSNSQGIKDIDALRQGLDPNDPMVGTTPQTPPGFGCGAHIAPSGDAGMAAAPVLAAAAAIGALRRRRRRSF